MTLILTLLVRDEEDILYENMLFHLNSGCDHIIVTDNLSVDNTPDIINEFVKQGCATCIKETDDDYSQSKWVTRMARMAKTEFGANWVINADADEFWVGKDILKLREFFDSHSTYDVFRAERHDFVALDNMDPPFWNSMIYRKSISLNPLGRPLPPKVAHRASASVTVGQGNHKVFELESQKPLRELPEGLSILHFPLRSETQYLNKIMNGGKAYANNTTLEPHIGGTWRNQYKELKTSGSLSFVKDNTYSKEDVRKGLENGTLIEDRRLQIAISSLMDRDWPKANLC